ncbi:MAG: hypothetical protein KY462_00825 [Actinobacteria bacterium]|nr:hypothetical protein [Actinomycetota bacterium]
MTTQTEATCTCGCGVTTNVTDAAEGCACGCACCSPPESKDEEVAELHRLREAIETRLDELGAS